MSIQGADKRRILLEENPMHGFYRTHHEDVHSSIELEESLPIDYTDSSLQLADYSKCTDLATTNKFADRSNSMLASIDLHPMTVG